MAIGLILAIAWNYTILCGFYILFCPASYLMFINHKLYRKVVDFLFALWELYPVALFQCCCNTELHHFGDYVDRDENTILIINHRTRVDWNYVWIALYHATQDPNAGNHCICRDSTEINQEPESFFNLGGKSKIKIVLKDEIKFTPCLGWIMQLNNFLFVKRNWQEDELNVSQFVDYYKKLRYSCRVVLFPEGTDLSDDNKKKSNKFAAARNLPCYEYVLHPRTTGWAVLCSKLRAARLTSVYDVTLAYDKPMQTELDLLKGRIPHNVYIYFKRYGRKPTLIFAVVIEVFAGIMASFLPDYWSFTLVRTIVGVSVGGVMIVGFVIVMEYVGNVYRDLASVMYHVPFTIGHMFLGLFGYLIRDYMILQLTMSLCNVILLLYICLLPETPRWLLAKNKTVKAIDLMERVAKINGLPTEEIRQKMELDQINNIRTRNNKGTVLDLFRTPNIRRNILVMSFMWLSCSYCFYGVAHYISHLTGNVFINVAACGCVCLCGCFLCIPMVRFLKRKTLVVISNVLSSACFFIIIFIPQGMWATFIGCVGCLCNYMVFIVIYLYASELFPTVVRNAALGISSMMARFGAMVAPFVAALRPHGKWCAPVAFGIMPLLAALLCLLLPETKDCELMTTLQEGEDFGKKSSQGADIVVNNTEVIK